jgi:hypothetical protein
LNADHTALEPLPYVDFGTNRKFEKDLENLIARHLLGVLFEEAQLLPIFQERQWQPESDIYALDEVGDLVVFELKLEVAPEYALQQLFRYTQVAGQWTYAELSRKFQSYCQTLGLPERDLKEAHREAFALREALNEDQFNRVQHMRVVGSAADQGLVRAVDFWRRKGLSIDFLPYRVFELGAERYFEFFAKPYDVHVNPADIKGVIFDTNRSYDEDPERAESLKGMIEKRRVSAFGNSKDAVRCFRPRDYVFYSHRWVGIVAAAQVLGPIKSEGADELYFDVKFLTPVPDRYDDASMKKLTFQRVKEVTGKSFYWARTNKVPYLSRVEAEGLLEALQREWA